MENASKALLIAASVLIVILLIAFGISIFRSGQGTGDALEVTMSATEKASFNSKFTSYCGTNKSAAQAKALAQVIISNNATNTLKVDVNIDSAEYNSSSTDDFGTDLTNAVSALSGMVKIEAIYENGIVTKMRITK